MRGVAFMGLLVLASCVERVDRAPARVLDAKASGARFDTLSVNGVVGELLASSQPPEELRGVRHWEHLRTLYLKRALEPLWVETGRISARVEATLAVLKDAPEHGLSTEPYDLDALRAELHRLRELERPELTELVAFDVRLSDVLIQHLLDLERGQFEPADVRWGWGRPPLPDPSPPLELLARTGSAMEAVAAARPPHPEYERLRQALADHRELAARGGWPQLDEGKTLRKGMNGPSVVTLRKRLAATGDGPTALPEFEAETFDAALAEAVKAFQRRHGLEENGHVDARTLEALRVPVEERIAQLEANLERWRWLPRKLGERHLWVNLPEYELVARENGEERLRMQVVIGAPRWQTPVRHDEVTAIWTDPVWTVTRRQLVEDVLPQLGANPGANAAKLGLHVYTRDGQPVDPTTVDWSRAGTSAFPYRVSQDPGPGNPLGRFKFELPNRLNIFLHDTPTKWEFQLDERRRSHGCVRVEDPRALAEFLLGPGPLHEKLEKALAKKKTLRVAVEPPVPVYLTYFTAWRDPEGRVHFRDDVYERERPMVQALLERTRSVNEARAEADKQPASGGTGGAGD